ncbi:protein of unknown function [Reichenbachiella agariperforans]|uniref:DUF4301 domain-containing protein n=1 Tax=Reichenbachiella agariperforans TaxID=156994 RepID=A0A1M6WU97_REIAG|nr:DUF4301 family protein [Reichenbachiella agariperforans]SHK97317.1 protein of unknown function [Reichenbachiella agariperforans]
MLNEEDKIFIAERGSDLSNVERQIENFKKGFPYLDVQRAAAVGDGIIHLSEAQVEALTKEYQEAKADKKVLKFVPASGAATRMFKDLFAFVADQNLAENKAAQVFMDGLADFAFYDELSSYFEDINAAPAHEVVDKLLSDEGMEYGSLPKALLQFHPYEKGARTPLEEHFVEGVHYAQSGDGVVHLHFTVSPQHLPKFEDLVGKVKPGFESAFGVTFDITFSQQKASTDTIAVDHANAPFREDNGTILFRPAGHGALLENLNDLDADIIFIKNIDNVVPDRLKADTYAYKQALAGLLVGYQNEVFGLLKDGINDPVAVAKQLDEKYFLKTSVGFADLSKDEQVAELKTRLNRPIRICGMVKNTGEPGGGPFWVKESDGSASLQIAETAQIDLENAEKSAMLKNSTHFNPVDLICATKDYQGKKFDLLQYRDDETGFITSKSKNGKDLKAMELPGLWNGAMAKWNTLFVEVPISTFNPVKTVNDLLKETHQ